MKSIKSRLLFYMLLVTIIPLIAFLVYSLVFVSSETTESEIDSNKSNVRWASQYLDSVNDQLEDIVYSMHVEDSLLSNVDQSNIDSLRIEVFLRNSLYANANLISQIIVYSFNSSRSVSIDFENGFNSKLLSYDDPILENGMKPVGIRYHQYENSIYVTHTINKFSDQSTQGIIVIKLNNNIINELSSIFGEDADYMLLNDTSMIYGDDLADTAMIYANINDGNKNIITIETETDMFWIKRVSNQDLYIVSMVELDILKAVNRNIIDIGLFIVLLSLAATIPTSIIFSNRLSSPIIKLVNHMKSSGYTTIKETSSSYDEITRLENSYNQMIEEINALILERYQNIIDRQNAQLKALQAQINPHFLANTFQLIGGMALSIDAENIYNATINMSNLVRYSMSLNQDYTTLNDELTHIQDYLSIQKMRFGDNLDFMIEIPSELRNVKIPKLTLQPIIENSFKHGLKKLNSKWEITVSAKVDANITILIEDNGKGVNPSKLVQINDQFMIRDNYLKIKDEEYFSGIGLTNIDSRIKLLYGSEYGLQLNNKENRGFIVAIKIPLTGGIK